MIRLCWGSRGLVTAVSVGIFLTVSGCAAGDFGTPSENLEERAYEQAETVMRAELKILQSDALEILRSGGVMRIRELNASGGWAEGTRSSNSPEIFLDRGSDGVIFDVEYGEASLTARGAHVVAVDYSQGLVSGDIVVGTCYELQLDLDMSRLVDAECSPEFLDTFGKAPASKYINMDSLEVPDLH